MILTRNHGFTCASWCVAGLRSSYTVDYEHFVNRTLTPYVTAARNVTIAAAAAAAVVLVTVMVGRLLGRAWLRRLHRMSTRTRSQSIVAVAGSLIDEGHFEGHLDDLCECHVTSAMTSPSAGPMLYPCSYSETIVWMETRWTIENHYWSISFFFIRPVNGVTVLFI